MYKSQFQMITGFTEEQAENLLKSNPYFRAEHQAYKETKDIKPPATESVDYLTAEQKQNLLKNPQFAAEHEAFVSTLKKSR